MPWMVVAWSFFVGTPEVRRDCMRRRGGGSGESTVQEVVGACVTAWSHVAPRSVLERDHIA